MSDRATAAFVVYTAVEWIASRLMLSEAGTPIDPAVDAVSDMVSRFLFRDTTPVEGGRRARGGGI